MREKVTESYSYGKYDPGCVGFGKRRFGFLRAFKPTNAENIRRHFGDSEDSCFMKLHDRIWSYVTVLAAIGFIAIIVCAVAALFQLAATRGSFFYGLLDVLKVGGWWIFLICAGIAFLGWLCGAFCKFQSWLKERL